MKKSTNSQVSEKIDNKLDFMRECTSEIMEHLISIRAVIGEISFMKYLQSEYLDKTSDDIIEKT